MLSGACGDGTFLRRVLIVAAVVVLALLAWHLVDVLLLVFGAVLIAVLLRALARPDRPPDPALRRLGARPGRARRAGPHRARGLAVRRRAAHADRRSRRPAARCLALVRGAPGHDRARRTPGEPRAGRGARRRQCGLGAGRRGDLLRRRPHRPLADRLRRSLSGRSAGPLSARRSPAVPAGGTRERIAGTLEASGKALRLWLLGQLVSMSFLFVLTGLGLWAIGVPAALALALLAGLAQFVPLIGPIVAAVPALLIALSEGLQMALWTLLLYVAIQQVESNIITPLVQRQAVSLPPAVTLFAVVAFGVLLGPLGILFATPLAVVAMVAVKRLWVRDTLRERTDLPGEG